MLFHGQYFDADAGLLYLRARFYDPSTGMYLQHDPIGYEDSPNLYAGLGQNPASLRDPTGTVTVGVGAALKVKSPNLRPTVNIRTATGVGAKYQKLPQFTGVGKATRTQRSPLVNAVVDTVVKTDRSALAARFRRQTEQEMQKDLANFDSEPTQVTANPFASRSSDATTTAQGPAVEDMSTIEGAPVQPRFEDHMDEFFDTDLLELARAQGIKMRWVEGSEIGGNLGEFRSATGEILINAKLRNDPAAAVQTIFHELGHYWWNRKGISRRYQGSNVLAEEAAVDLKAVMMEMDFFEGSPKFKSTRRRWMEGKHGGFNAWRDQWLIGKYLERARHGNNLGALGEFYRRFPGVRDGWSP
jgi:RHS repeat-associated protein